MLFCDVASTKCFHALNIIYLCQLKNKEKVMSDLYLYIAIYSAVNAASSSENKSVKNISAGNT
jgi:hypothetical protein